MSDTQLLTQASAKIAPPAQASSKSNVSHPREAARILFENTPPTQEGSPGEEYMRYAAIVPHGEGKWQLYEDLLPVHVDAQKRWWPDYYKVTRNLCKFLDWEDDLGLEEASNKEFRSKSNSFLRYTMEMTKKWGDDCIPQDIRVYYNWLRERRNEKRRTFRKSLGFAKFDEQMPSSNDLTFASGKGVIIDYRFPSLHVDNYRVSNKKRKHDNTEADNTK